MGLISKEYKLDLSIDAMGLSSVMFILKTSLSDGPGRPDGLGLRWAPTARRPSPAQHPMGRASSGP